VIEAPGDGARGRQCGRARRGRGSSRGKESCGQRARTGHADAFHTHRGVAPVGGVIGAGGGDGGPARAQLCLPQREAIGMLGSLETEDALPALMGAAKRSVPYPSHFSLNHVQGVVLRNSEQ